VNDGSVLGTDRAEMAQLAAAKKPLPQPESP
jgi:hypothetical protein